MHGRCSGCCFVFGFYTASGHLLCSTCSTVVASEELCSMLLFSLLTVWMRAFALDADSLHPYIHTSNICDHDSLTGEQWKRRKCVVSQQMCVHSHVSRLLFMLVLIGDLVILSPRFFFCLRSLQKMQCLIPFDLN